MHSYEYNLARHVQPLPHSYDLIGQVVVHGTDEATNHFVDYCAEHCEELEAVQSPAIGAHVDLAVEENIYQVAYCLHSLMQLALLPLIVLSDSLSSLTSACCTGQAER